MTIKKRKRIGKGNAHQRERLRGMNMYSTHTRIKSWYTMGCRREEWEGFCSLSVDTVDLNKIE